jgi:hypothetical protein
LYSYSRLFISRFLMIFKGCFHESQESLVFLCTVKSVELKLTQFHEPPLLMKFIFSSMIWVRDVRRKSSTTAMACCYRKINHEKKNRLVSMHVVQHSWTHIWALFKVAVSAPPEPRFIIGDDQDIYFSFGKNNQTFFIFYLFIDCVYTKVRNECKDTSAHWNTSSLTTLLILTNFRWNA